MTITPYIAYATALAIAVAIPGPGVAAIVGRALGTGFWRTLPMLSGLVLGDLIYLVLAVGGLAVLAKAFAGTFIVIKLAGACYLGWLAFKFWTTGIKPSEALPEKSGNDTIASFLGGLAVTLGNPKAIVFYMAITPAVIDIHSVTPVRLAVLAVITAGVLYGVLTPYVAMAARARSALKNPRALQRINRFAALAMAATAGYVIIRS